MTLSARDLALAKMVVEEAAKAGCEYCRSGLVSVGGKHYIGSGGSGHGFQRVRECAAADILALDLSSLPVERLPEDEWRAMVYAPLDGTEVELLVRHFTYWTARKLDGVVRADAEWQGTCRAKWIDHNGGGWTWSGHAGTPIGWKPIDAAIAKEPK